MNTPSRTNEISYVRHPEFDSPDVNYQNDKEKLLDFIETVCLTFEHNIPKDYDGDYETISNYEFCQDSIKTIYIYSGTFGWSEFKQLVDKTLINKFSEQVLNDLDFYPEGEK